MRSLQTFAEEAAGIDANGNEITQILTSVEQSKRITEEIERRRFIPSLNPPQIRPVFSIQGIPICTPGNLTTIVAAAKTGKTAVVGAMLASVIAAENSSADTLGFQSRNREGKAVLHFDTEQSVDDHWHLITRSMRRASVNELPPWFFSYCLTGFEALKAREAVYLATKNACDAFKGIHSILIDGYADLVLDVNNAEECNAFVACLHDEAMQRDCPIVGILHFNPGTEKSRGHLGSQLERKSETNLRLDKEGTITEVWSEKQRRAPILRGNGPRFRWDDLAAMHVSVESGSEARRSAKAAAARNYVEEVFFGQPAMRYTALKSTVIKVLKVEERTAERRIEEWRQLGVVEKTAVGLWAPKH